MCVCAWGVYPMCARQCVACVVRHAVRRVAMRAVAYVRAYDLINDVPTPAVGGGETGVGPTYGVAISLPSDTTSLSYCRRRMPARRLPPAEWGGVVVTSMPPHRTKVSMFETASSVLRVWGGGGGGLTRHIHTTP